MPRKLLGPQVFAKSKRTLNIKLTDQQLAFVNSDTPCTLISGGMGSGKSIALIVSLLLIAASTPGGSGVLSRTTYRELEDTTKKFFFEWCPANMIKEYQASTNSVYLNTRGDKPFHLMFRHLESPEEIKSMEVCVWCIDELTQLDNEEVFNLILSRLRSPRSGRTCSGPRRIRPARGIGSTGASTERRTSASGTSTRRPTRTPSWWTGTRKGSRTPTPATLG